MQMEKQFAVKAVQHMQTYWSILERVKGSTLRLTKMDADILEHLHKDFPEFDPAETIDEDKMKSKEGKARWRTFMMAYEKKIDDYNFGTMLRSNPKWEYGEKETIFGASGGSDRPRGRCPCMQCRGGDGRTRPDRLLTDRRGTHSAEDAVLRHRDCEVGLLSS